MADADFDFQPIDFQPEEQQQAAPVPAAQDGINFQPIDFQPAQPSDEDQIAQQTKQQLAPLADKAPQTFLGTGKVTQDELSIIAKNRGVPVEKLMPAVGWLGGYREQSDSADIGRTVAAKAADLIPFGGAAVQRGFKELYDDNDPKLRAAYDDLQELVDKKKSLAESGVELGAGLLTGMGEAKLAGMAGKAAYGTAKAAERAEQLFNVAQTAGIPVDMALRARQGEELPNFAIGAALGGGVMVLEKAILKKAPEMLAEVAENAKAGSASEAVAARRATTEAADNISFNVLRGTQELDEQSTQELANAARKVIGDDDVKFIEDAAEKSGTDVNELLAHRYLEDESVDFAKTLRPGTTVKTLEDARQVVDEFAKQEGQSEEFVRAKWNDSKNTSTLSDLAEEGVVAQALDQSPLQRWRDWVVDGKYAVRGIDRRLQAAGLDSNVEGLQQTLSGAFNTVNGLKAAAIQQTKDINNVLRQSKTLDKIYSVLDTGEGVSELDDAGKTAVGKIQDYFNEWRQWFEDSGFKIEKLSGEGGEPSLNYIPHQMLNPVDRTLAFRAQANKVFDSLQIDVTRPLTRDQFKQVADSDVGKDLISGIAAVTGNKVIEEKQFGKLLQQAISPTESAARETTIAARALQREGTLPMFLRETDPVKLMTSWVDGTARHFFSRDAISKLSATRDQAVLLGDKAAGEYLSNMIGDLVGSRVEGRLSTAIKDVVSSQQLAWKTRAAAAPDGSFRQKLYQAVGDSPNILGAAQAWLYPTYLGLSPRATLMHMLHIPTIAIPELGNVYGSLVSARAAGSLVNDMQLVARGAKDMLVTNAAVAKKYGVQIGETVKIKSIADVLRNDGLISQDMANLKPALSAMEQGLKSTALYGMSKTASEQLAQKSMMIFQASEMGNRLWITKMADKVSEDLINNRAGAINFLKGVGTGPQREMLAAKAAGDAEGLQKQLRQYLIAKTAFNYDKATMSGFGRAAGPFLSIFTKIPSSIAGDVLEKFETRGAWGGGAEVFRKYVAPYVALWGIGETLLPSPKDDPVARMFLGKNGLGAQAPIGAAADFFQGNLISPPLIESTKTVFKAAADTDWTDPDSIAAGGLRAGHAVLPFTPAGLVARMIERDLPAYNGE